MTCTLYVFRFHIIAFCGKQTSLSCYSLIIFPSSDQIESLSWTQELDPSDLWINHLNRFYELDPPIEKKSHSGKNYSGSDTDISLVNIYDFCVSFLMLESSCLLNWLVQYYIFLMFPRGKTVIQVWNNMRVHNWGDYGLIAHCFALFKCLFIISEGI